MTASDISADHALRTTTFFAASNTTFITLSFFKTGDKSVLGRFRITFLATAALLGIIVSFLSSPSERKMALLEFITQTGVLGYFIVSCIFLSFLSILWHSFLEYKKLKSEVNGSP